MTVKAPSQRAEQLVATVAQRRGERAPEPAPADDGQARTGRGVRGAFPFQFSHLRYRSAMNADLDPKSAPAKVTASSGMIPGLKL
jgi:hypothetical protein